MQRPRKPASRPAASQQPRLIDPEEGPIIRIRPTDDGTYIVYRDAAVVLTGLTRDQAYVVAPSIGATVAD